MPSASDSRCWKRSSWAVAVLLLGSERCSRPRMSLSSWAVLLVRVGRLRVVHQVARASLDPHTQTQIAVAQRHGLGLQQRRAVPHHVVLAHIEHGLRRHQPHHHGNRHEQHSQQKENIRRSGHGAGLDVKCKSSTYSLTRSLLLATCRLRAAVQERWMDGWLACDGRGCESGAHIECYRKHVDGMDGRLPS